MEVNWLLSIDSKINWGGSFNSCVANFEINHGILFKQMTSVKPVKPPRSIPMIAKIYLIVYNTVQFLGWSYIFYLTTCYFKEGLDTFSSETLWKKVKLLLLVFQTGAIFEV